MYSIGIIAGSGVEKLLFPGKFKKLKVKTKYGSVMVQSGKVEGKEVVFINRHGPEYCLPHEIDFRKNIQALKQCGVKTILATATVGAINRKIRPGDFTTLSDFIDFTQGKRITFTKHAFIDISQPYDPSLNKKILLAAKKLKIKMHRDAIYVCTEGPRFETRAEIRVFGSLGADVVGMTQVPEVVLAAEAGIPYAVVAVITNYAAGISKEKITYEEVTAMMKEKGKLLSRLLSETIKLI